MYQVWRVFKDKGVSEEFYVVNIGTKEVQSVWKKYSDAYFTTTKLNGDVKRDSKNDYTPLVSGVITPIERTE